MQKVDLRRQLKHLYSPSARDVSVVDVPRMNFFMTDGEGDPNTAESYKQAIEALYAASYTLKFMLKQGSEAIDYPVMPLEGLWWSGDGTPLDPEHKDGWKWTAMIMQPDFLTLVQAEEAIDRAQKRRDLPGLHRLRFGPYDEGRAAQILYVGPYADEAPTIERLHAAIKERGGRIAGKHHEIYLSDPRRTASEKLKTVLRQPFVEDGGLAPGPQVTS